MVTDIWAEFLNIIRQEVGSRVVETWFKAVSLVRWDAQDSVIYLQAPNSFVRDWIKSHYSLLIHNQLARLLNVDKVTVIFLDTNGNKATDYSQVPVIEDKASNSVTIVPAKKLTQNGIVRHRDTINRQHLFDTFVIGSNNSLAYAAAQAVASRPGTIYNPLFLYGGSGLGKTHLLHAIGNAVKANDKRRSIVYQTADRFVHEFITAIRFDDVAKFQGKYKSADVLLIDDVQFISNKDQTQEAFFHIYNSLYEAHKQIVFTSDTLPQHIKGIAERLKSRLSSGLVADLHSPTLETKIAIIKRKASVNNEMVSDEVAHCIAGSVSSNVRELEGALMRVIAFATLTQQSVSLELAQQVLKVPTNGGILKLVGVNQVLSSIEKKYSYSITQLQSKNRNKELSIARQIAMFLLKKMTGKSLRDIGILLGGRDHSTVLHAINRIETLMRVDESFKNELRTIQEGILQHHL